jgi:hypothetical protein
MVDIAIRTYSPSTDKVSKGMNDFRVYLKSMQREILKQEAALAARAFIIFSPPISPGGGRGDKSPARKQGQIAVDRDIRSIFAPLNATLKSAIDPSYGGMKAFMEWRDKPLRGGRASDVLRAIHQDPVPERAFKKAINLYGNKTRSVHQVYVLNDSSELSEVHSKQRKQYRGRITRKGGPDASIKQAPYFAEPSALDRYIKLQQNLVGTLQSGWVKVILSIGTVRLRGQDLITAQKNLPKHLYTLAGTGTVRYDSSFFARLTGGGNQSFVTIKNPRGNINGVGDEASTKAKVIDYRKNQLAARSYRGTLAAGIREWRAGQAPKTV